MERSSKRAKLPLWSAVCLGLHGILQKPVRLVVVIFLTTFSLVLLGLSVTMAFYSDDRAVAESMVLHDRVSLVTKADMSDFSKEDLAALRDRSGRSYGLLCPAPTELLPDLMQFTAGRNARGEELRGCLRKSPLGFVVLNDDVLAETDRYVLTGRLPAAKDEIALPCCLANSFMALNYYDNISSPQVFNDYLMRWEYDEDEVTPICAYEDILGKKLWLAGATGADIEATIIGVLEYDCFYFGNHSQNQMNLTIEDQLIVSQEYAEELTGKSGAEFAVAGPPRNAAEAAKLYDYAKEGSVVLGSEAIEQVAKYRKTINGFAGAFVGVGIAFAVFAGALIFQFVNLSIEAKREQVGILRALGARSVDVCRIFFSESAFLALISAALSVPVTIGLSHAVNLILYELFFIGVAVMNFTIWMPVSVFALGILISFAATAAPVLREAKKTPIDAIRDAS